MDLSALDKLLQSTSFKGTPRQETSYVAPPPTEGENRTVLKESFLLPSHKLSWDLLDIFQERRELSAAERFEMYDRLMSIPHSINRTRLRFKRRGISGEIDSYQEALDLASLNENASNSLSVNRQFGSKQDAIRGKTGFLPFQPGGLDPSQLKDATSLLHKDEDGLFDVPQGLSRGLKAAAVVDLLKEEVSSLEKQEPEEEPENEEPESEPKSEPEEPEPEFEEPPSTPPTPQDSEILQEIDDILPVNVKVSSALAQTTTQKHKRQYAHMVELNHRIDNFDELVPHMAREWPFQLDIFQQEAIYHLEQGDSVFIAAHTSAGKTVVAEYAIAMANRNMTKAIYTSPIKALSNQKFRDFKTDFEDLDVGLITGDVQINPEANCLIMTTEILRSMLYRGADLIRDVEFVIFDEVHYVNDMDRGVVWEEVIIMLPDHIKLIMLSATVPNTFEFASWIGRTKQKDVYVISTPKRPVPLEIHIWTKNDIIKVVDAQRKFLEGNFTKHKEMLTKSGSSVGTGRGGGAAGRGSRGDARGGAVAGRGNRGGSTRGNGRGGGASGRVFMRDGPNKHTWIDLAKFLRAKDLLPAVIFVFSKKRCEDYADTLTSIDFCNAREKSQIHMFVDKAVSRLRKEDRELPQIMKIREMLSRGIAVHHGGLLPIVKEVIEILFARSLIKMLFATETFAMGLNLPTRTVVFQEIRKHDGNGFRNLLPGEFTQMSGRAGRRGLDTIGTVIIMAYNEPLSPSALKEVVLGMPTKLSSQFRLTYNMILNLLRIEALRVEEMIKRSFSENTAQSLLPEHEQKVVSLEKKLATLHVQDCDCKLDGLAELYNALKSYKELYGLIIKEALGLKFYQSKFQVGRLIVFRYQGVSQPGFISRMDLNTGKALILTFGTKPLNQSVSYYMGIPFVARAGREFIHKFHPMLQLVPNDVSFKAVSFEDIEFIGRYVLKTNIRSLVSRDPETVKEFHDEVAKLLQFQHKWEEFGFSLFTNLNLHELLQKKDEVVAVVHSVPVMQCQYFAEHYKQYSDKEGVAEQIAELKKLISDDNLELLPDYEQRLKVLQSLGFVDKNLNVVLKGRVACEINSGWELVITELVLNNFLGDFTSEEIVALLSCFVYEGKTNEDEEPSITPRLEMGKHKIKEIMGTMLQVYQDFQIPLTQEEECFLEAKRFALVNVVFEWARGMSFFEIMKLSVEAEGTIVRVITRLDEICREVKNAALIIGDADLHSKMSDAQEKIKRDIVFCASLYL